VHQAEQVDKNVNLLRGRLTIGQDAREASRHGANSHVDSTAASTPAMCETSIEREPEAGKTEGGAEGGAEDRAAAWTAEGLSAEAIHNRLAQKFSSLEAEASQLKRLLDNGASCVS
jgi:hypothetical protein